MNKAPFIGQLDRKVVIKQASEEIDTTGERSTEFTEVVTCWAYLQQNDGVEDLEGKLRYTAERTYIIRYNSQLKVNTMHKMFLEDANSIYEITHGEEIGRKRFLKLQVQKSNA